MDAKECKNKTECVLKEFFIGKKIQNLVLGGVEFVLPILVIIALIGCVVGAFQTAILVGAFSGAIAGIFTFIVSLVGYIVAALLSFYLIYAIKSIKDNIAGENEFCFDFKSKNSCKTNVEPEEQKNATAANNKSNIKSDTTVKKSPVKKDTAKASSSKETKPRTRKTVPKE